jgi:hypothetical protein
MESADQIKKSIQELLQFCLRRENLQLRKENIDEYKQKCMQTYTDVHQKYPTLFFTVIENPTGFPMGRLDELLRFKRKIETQEANEEEVNKELGEKYYNEFVKDKISQK